MRRLFLARHAKSGWAGPGCEDFDRPLSERGRRQAPLLGAYLARQPEPPTVVLCSGARRTVETLDHIQAQLASPIPSEIRNDLYLALPTGLLSAIRDLGNGPASVMLIGHNPGVQETAGALVGSGNDRLLVRLGKNFPTAGLVVIDFSVEHWADIGPKDGVLEDFVRPKDLEI